MIVIDGTLTNPDYPRFLYDNLSESATVTASTSASGFAATNVQNALTWNFWRPTAQDSYLEFDFGSDYTINAIGIAAHNMGTQGNTVTIQYWDGLSPGSWVTIDSHVPVNDSIIMFLFADVTAQVFKISVSGGSVPSIGVVYMGQQLVAERKIYGGHSPVTLSVRSVIRPNKSEKGQWLGRTVANQGATVNIKLDNMTASWVRNYYHDFIVSAVTKPFFFAWRPTSYPKEVAYCWTDKDITATNIGKADLMESSFTANALIGADDIDSPDISGDYIITDSGDFITTDGGDYIVTG